MAMAEPRVVQINREHEANIVLFQVVHELAARLAGRPVPVVLEALRARLPDVPGLTEVELVRIAEEVSVGRDPSGL